MLCGDKGRFLYEACPDIFPQGYLTDTELHLWGLYYVRRNQQLDAAKRR